MRPIFALTALACITLAGCSGSHGSASCGIAALTGPLAVKESFGQGNVMTTMPEFAPKSLPVRLVAGPAWRGLVAADSTGGWRITLQGTVSRSAHIGYGVVVFDTLNAPRGVFAFDGTPVRGATHLGSLVMADTVVPLLAVRVPVAAIQDPRCPAFPDSLR